MLGGFSCRNIDSDQGWIQWIRIESYRGRDMVYLVATFLEGRITAPLLATIEFLCPLQRKVLLFIILGARGRPCAEIWINEEGFIVVMQLQKTSTTPWLSEKIKECGKVVRISIDKNKGEWLGSFRP